MNNATINTERKVGIEIEFSGISAGEAAKIIQSLYQGKIKKLHSIKYKVVNTELGDFTIELDAKPVQRLADYSKELQEDTFIGEVTSEITSAVHEYSSKIVPVEIIAPPISVGEIYKLEYLVKALREHKATDTKSTAYNAFGLHLNPEVNSKAPEILVSHIQSFLLLEPWLYKKHDVDITRRLSPFIQSFPSAYLALVLNLKYRPSMTELIRDYHEHNPTRNRPLDCLPLFAHINQHLINALYQNKEKINARPTFHYRLPNCELSNPNWSITREWHNWLNVERIANDDKLKKALITKWRSWYCNTLSFKSDWIAELDKIMLTQQ